MKNEAGNKTVGRKQLAVTPVAYCLLLTLITIDSTSLLRPQPSLGNFIAAGKQIILVAAGDETFVGQLHPPSSCFLALQKCGLYFCESKMIFIERIFFIQLRFSFS